MCGLFGAISTQLLQTDLDILYVIGTMSVIRGMDSAGIAVVSPKPDKEKEYPVHLSKRLTNSAELLADKRVQAILDEGDKVCVMGHTRAATMGAINKNNIHPFSVKDKLFGAHNGTIRGFVKWKKEKGKVWKNNAWVDGEIEVQADRSENDSRILFDKLYSDGLEALSEEIKSVNGAAAITWIDVRDNTFNVWRNIERPLFFMRSSDCTVLYWCSDEEILSLAKKREQGTYSPYSVAPYTHYKFPLGSKIEDHTQTPLKPAPKVMGGFSRELEPKPAVIVPLLASKARDKNIETFYGFYSCRERRNTPQAVYEQVFSETEKVEEKKEEITECLWSGWMPENPLNYSAAQAALKKGCKECKTECDPFEDTWWVSKDEYYCSDCVEELKVIRHIQESRLVLRKSEVSY